MALRNLVEGECGGANPLMKVANHFARPDAQELAGPSTRLDASNHLVNEFLAGNGQQGPSVAALKRENVFRMDALLNDMQRIDAINNQGHNHPAQLDPLAARALRQREGQWCDQFMGHEQHRGPQPQMHQEKWATEYLVDSPRPMAQPKLFPQLDTLSNVRPDEQFRSHLPPQPFFQPPLNAVNYHHHEQLAFASHAAQQSVIHNQVHQTTLPEEARRLAQSVQGDKDLSATDFLDFVNKLGNETIKVQADGQVTEEASAATAGAQGTSKTSPVTSAKTWAQEFIDDKERQQAANNQDLKEDKDDLAFWEYLANEWDSMSKEDNEAYSWLDGYDQVTEPFAGDYSFAEENMFKDHPDAFEEGMKKLEEGDIPSAVLLFEAACQQNSSNAKAWQFLGTTQAKNEHDSNAIRALKKCAELEPSNLVAWMALAVSYTNEAMQRQACDALGEWIRRNPKYAELVRGTFIEDTATAPPPVTLSSMASSGHMNLIRDAYIKAARLFPVDIDADVQSGLGVLFNLTGEYSKAADCFRAALEARPDDPLLWNRLGATLANGNQSEEAVSSYRRALEISPGFIRSRFNLGISCINLGAHQSAAEHFLAVLNLQNAGRGPKGESSRTAMSNNVWTSLRMVLSMMNRQDLYGAVERRDLDTMNKEFNFVLDDSIKEASSS